MVQKILSGQLSVWLGLGLAVAGAAAIATWQAKAAPLKGTPIVVQHHAWIYMERWLGLVEVVPLEPTKQELRAQIEELRAKIK